MAQRQDPLERVRAICLELPDTEEEAKWGKPHFCVAGKIFAGCDTEAGKTSFGCKLDKAHQAKLIAADPRVTVAPYVGKHGWISMELTGRIDWAQVRELILESYRLIAPRAAIAMLDGTESPAMKRAKPKKATRTKRA